MKDFARFALKEFRAAESLLGIKEPVIDSKGVFSKEDDDNLQDEIDKEE